MYRILGRQKKVKERTELMRRPCFSVTLLAIVDLTSWKVKEMERSNNKTRSSRLVI